MGHLILTSIDLLAMRISPETTGGTTTPLPQFNHDDNHYNSNYNYTIYITKCLYIGVLPSL